jgi:hypothetical protein
MRSPCAASPGEGTWGSRIERNSKPGSRGEVRKIAMGGNWESQKGGDERKQVGGGV